MITAAIAAKAYAAAQAQATEDTLGASTAAGGASFGDVLKGVMNDTIQTSKTAEAKVVAGMQGKADLLDVVSSLTSAQTSLQLALAVRDQMITAYNQILALQI